MKSIGLIACVAAKRAGLAPAGDLYTSALFRKTRAYVQSRCDHWYILSALHGLLSPEQLIEPYNVTLNNMKASARRTWSKQVLVDLLARAQEPTRFVILAGDRYRSDLVQPLRDAGHTIEVPMEGLTIGRQLAWLTSARS